MQPCTHELRRAAAASPAASFSSVLIIFIVTVVRESFACQVHLCYTEYTNLASGYSRLQQQQQQQQSRIFRSLNSRESQVKEYCNSLEAYSACMKGLNRSCRGKLDYHAVIAHVNKWIDDYNCTGTQKSRVSKSSFNLTLRQQSERHGDYPWTGSSSISHSPTVRRKRKRCRKHPHHSTVLHSTDATALSSSSSSFASSSSSSSSSSSLTGSAFSSLVHHALTLFFIFIVTPAATPLT